MPPLHATHTHTHTFIEPHANASGGILGTWLHYKWGEKQEEQSHHTFGLAGGGFFNSEPSGLSMLCKGPR